MCATVAGHAHGMQIKIQELRRNCRDIFFLSLSLLSLEEMASLQDQGLGMGLLWWYPNYRSIEARVSGKALATGRMKGTRV